MNVSGWLRFGELSLLAAWLVWRLYRPGPPKRGEGLVPLAAAMIAVGQLLLEGQSATDPFTSLAQVLGVMLPTVYGVLSAAIVVLGLATAAWLWIKGSGAGRSTWLAAPVASAVLLVCAAVGTGDAVDAASAASSTGEVAMSPTLAVPRSALSTPNPYANDPASATRGQQVYSHYCVACHGLNGDGNGPALAGLRIRPPTFRNPQHFLAPGMDGAHFWVVQHGDGVPGAMPAWQGTLTDQQTWDAVDYIKQLAQGRPTVSSGSSRPGG